MEIKRDTKKVHLIDDLLLNPENRVEILVMGAGGTGSRFINNLARINTALRGLDKNELFVTVYDDQEVEQNNVGRQQFFQEDIGINKAHIIIERINYAYGLDWISIPRRYSFESPGFHDLTDNNKGHIFVTCVDNMNTRKYFEKNITRLRGTKGKYWLDIGNGKDYGQVVLSYHGSDKKRNNLKTLNKITKGDYFKIKDKKVNEPSCSLAVSLGRQSLFINSILAELAGDMLFRFLNDYVIDYNGLYLNLRNLEINKIPIL